MAWSWSLFLAAAVTCAAILHEPTRLGIVRSPASRGAPRGASAPLLYARGGLLPRAGRILTLRGGDSSDNNEERKTEGLPEEGEGLPVYTGDEPEAEPNPDATYALDAVRLQMVLGCNAAHSWRAGEFMPKFAHQIFGPMEEIVGYIRPRVIVSYAADSLVPAVDFTHHGVCGEAENRTDVIGNIKKYAPADYINAARLPRHVEATRGIFEPPGEVVADYTEFELGKDEAHVRRTQEECGGNVRYEAFMWKAGDSCQAGRDLVRRSQSLALWMVESASYIDDEDTNWTCIFLYEKVEVESSLQSRSSPDHAPVYHLVGFTTVYRKSLDGMNEAELKELTPLCKEVKDRSGMVRLSVSQFVILPPYARRGHGTKLLRLVYKLARQDPSVLDVTVEDPNEPMIALRSSCDAAELRERHLLEPLRRAEPPWYEIQSTTKLSMVQLFHLAEVVGSEAGRAGVRAPAEDDGEAGKKILSKAEKSGTEGEGSERGRVRHDLVKEGEQVEVVKQSETADKVKLRSDVREGGAGTMEQEKWAENVSKQVVEARSKESEGEEEARETEKEEPMKLEQHNEEAKGEENEATASYQDDSTGEDEGEEELKSGKEGLNSGKEEPKLEQEELQAEMEEIKSGKEENKSEKEENKSEKEELRLRDHELTDEQVGGRKDEEVQEKKGREEARPAQGEDVVEQPESAYKSKKYPSLFGVPVDLELVYGRASVLGFTRVEIDDILHAIRADDLEGVKSPQDAAHRLLSGVYMAVVADLAQAEGLDDDEVDALLESIDTTVLLEAESPRDVARVVLPLIQSRKKAKR